MLSIRTQDRMTLVPYDSQIWIRDDWSLFIIKEVGVDVIKLGTYATKERALQVLDEIELALFGNSQYENNKYVEIEPDMFYRPVYQMPKE